MNPLTRFSLFFLVLLLLVSFLQVNAQEGFPYCEPLNDGQIPGNTIFGGNARLVADSEGNGVLQLTSNQEQQSGFVYVDIPFPSHYGIKASFEYFSYGGEEQADGLTFFLFDADVPSFQPGSFGGALGYAFSTNYQSPGLAGAYIGVGLDEYGNFSNSSEGKDGPGFRPNNITIRGPGEGYQGYEYITGIQTDDQGGLAEEDRFPISSGGINTSRVTDNNEAGYRKVFIDLKPSPDGVGMVLNLDMLVTTMENAPRMVSIFKDLPYRYDAPDHLKVGFAAATGGFTNYHEIKNIVVEVADDNLLLPEISDKTELGCKGEAKSFEVKKEDVLLPNKNSVISCLQLYKTLEEVVDEEAQDPCETKICNPANQLLELEQGVFTTDKEGGGISFAANQDAEGEEVVIYYTVTDNYGQTSAPALFKVKVSGFPEAPVIYEENTFAQEGAVPADSFRLCEGEKVQLKAVVAPNGIYQWFKNGVELTEETEDNLSVSSEGVYSVGIFNQASCLTMSQEVQVSYVLRPELSVDEPMVSCGKGPADLRLHIEGYDEVRFDYEVQSPDGSILMNEELKAVDEPGQYEIRSKHKDLDCWSEVLVRELLIVETPVEADFDYVVLLEGGGQEMLDIFINDRIQFNDLSLFDPVIWEWDFGDGSQSSEPNPQHAYSDEGNYIVSLTVYSKEGLCSSVKDKEVNVNRSYRIMYPTAFSPLGSENRYFKPKTKGIKEMALYVFNSWGDLIYVSDDITDQGWDGTSVGRLQPNGTYVFKVEFTTVLGKKVTDSGKFTLIR